MPRNPVQSMMDDWVVALRVAGANAVPVTRWDVLANSRASRTSTGSPCWGSRDVMVWDAMLGFSQLFPDFNHVQLLRFAKGHHPGHPPRIKV